MTYEQSYTHLFDMIYDHGV